jgi:hypothetical protein
MLYLLVGLGAVALGWTVATGTLRTTTSAVLPTTAPGTRERDRRLRWVERHPDHVNSGDVRRLLARDLPADQAELVVAKARLRGVRPLTMWLWVNRFGARTLALAIAADVTHDELLAHLGTGVAPDLETLEVFAALNGLGEVTTTPTDATATGPVVPAAPDARDRIPAPQLEVRAVKRLTRMPEITDPGGWPFGGWAADQAPVQEPPAEPGSGSFAA